jgi:hypothetical protein
MPRPTPSATPRQLASAARGLRRILRTPVLPRSRRRRPPPLGRRTMASSQDPLMLTPQSLKSHWRTPISAQRTGNSPEVRDSKTRRRWYREMRRPQGTYLLHRVARELTSLQEILRRRLVRKVPEWDRRPVQILLGNARRQVVGGMSHCTRLSMSTDTH